MEKLSIFCQLAVKLWVDIPWIPYRFTARGCDSASLSCCTGRPWQPVAGYIQECAAAILAIASRQPSRSVTDFPCRALMQLLLYMSTIQMPLPEFGAGRLLLCIYLQCMDTATHMRNCAAGLVGVVVVLLRMLSNDEEQQPDSAEQAPQQAAADGSRAQSPTSRVSSSVTPSVARSAPANARRPAHTPMSGASDAFKGLPVLSLLSRVAQQQIEVSASRLPQEHSPALSHNKRQVSCGKHWGNKAPRLGGKQSQCRRCRARCHQWSAGNYSRQQPQCTPGRAMAAAGPSTGCRATTHPQESKLSAATAQEISFY